MNGAQPASTAGQGRHVIHLRATGRRIPVAAYVAGVRRAIAQPDSTFRHGLETWWPVTGSDVRHEFRRALQDRINARAPGYGRGRKWADNWQRAAARVADRLAGRVIVMVRDCPAELRGRLAARLYTESDL